MEIEVMDFVEDLCNKESKSCLAYDDFLMETLNKYNFNMDIVKTTKGGRVISIGDFIICPSQRYYINEVISNIGLKKFTCVEGGHSCGKKELLKNVALGFNYAESAQKRIKLGSHIEYRDLVGIHVSSETSNQFQWRKGILTQSMIDGNFLILDSWDQSSVETCQYFTGILDNKCLYLPNGETYSASSKFMLTCTVNSERKLNNQTKIPNNHHWQCVSIPTLNNLDINFLLLNKFPNLKTIIPKLVDIYEEVKLISFCILNDIIRLCTLIGTDSSIVSENLLISPYNLVMSIISILCSSFSSDKKRIAFDKICVSINLDPNSATEIIANHYACFVESLFKPDSTKTFAITKTLNNLIFSLNTCLKNNHPVLLIGETGVGKTSLIQFLAESYEANLVVINVGRNSDVSSFFGGHKPVSIAFQLNKIINIFTRHFLTVNGSNNQFFIDNLLKLSKENKYDYIIASIDRALNLLSASGHPNVIIISELYLEIKIAKKILSQGQGIHFCYISGILLSAIKEGKWILIDEINLAPEELLSAISDIIENQYLYTSSEYNINKISIHPNFRIIACMNPPNDAGKKMLPLSICKKFVNFYMDDINDLIELTQIISFYLMKRGLDQFSQLLAEFYLDFRTYLANTSFENIEPTTSLRSLCRSLKICLSCTYIDDPQRSLYEGIVISFLSNLNDISFSYWNDYLKRIFSANFHTFSHKFPISSEGVVDVEGFPISVGRNRPFTDKNYIVTGIIKHKIKILSRILSLSNLPILLEGETAVGKTSIVFYIAKKTGNNCIRINNHEHTDIQDYVGSYICNQDGLFYFQVGALVEAMKRGDWVVLDELNLAPSDVLEMLNRLLDDNRQLFIDETQETVIAHPNFRIFATQNPAKFYSGRKELSKAFRNRFCEICCDDISNPDNISKILQRRYGLGDKICSFMVSTMQEFHILRKTTDVFIGKYGYITTRDLFKWTLRIKKKYQKSPLLPKVASIGFELLSSRCRYPADVNIIHKILSKFLVKSTLSLHIDFSLSIDLNEIILYQRDSSLFKHLLWTTSMLRNAYLLCEALRIKESVLLVGDTGSGKTSLCQLYAEATGRKLYVVTCHSGLESSDIIGSLTIKVAGYHKHFEWQDGLLTQALKNGGMFLLDEISLADDSILERVNSVLDSDSRSLVLYEKLSTNDDGSPEEVIAHPDFLFVATMNPSGDYGKRELSHALRNRFTEIWCANSNTHEHLKQILDHNIFSSLKTFFVNGKLFNTAQICLDLMSDIFDHQFLVKKISPRKLLSIAEFINTYNNQFKSDFPIITCLYECIISLFVDSNSVHVRSNLCVKIRQFLSNHFCLNFDSICVTPTQFCINSFDFIIYDSEKQIHKYPCPSNQERDELYNSKAPDVEENVRRINRAILFNKPIMLEGPPGCGKSVSITHLASLYGKKVVRINFSQQTELSDLFGSYFPFPDENQDITFKWMNGPFLEAIINNNWILLDELNLACQTVLEGLNSCLDHRSEVYISELNKTYSINRAEIRIFAAQNPQSHESGRKGLPKSFLDRFIVLNIDNFSSNTLNEIAQSSFPQIVKPIISLVVQFINEILSNFLHLRLNYNIRDIFRILELVDKWNLKNTNDMSVAFFLVFMTRIRNIPDFNLVQSIFIKIFHPDVTKTININPLLFYSTFKILPSGNIQLGPNYINPSKKIRRPFEYGNIRFFTNQYSYFGLISTAIEQNWPCLLVGSSLTGKTSLIKILSILYSIKLIIVTVTCETEMSDIIGDFDYIDYRRDLYKRITNLIETLTLNSYSYNTSFINQLKNILKNISMGKNTPSIYELFSTTCQPSVINLQPESIKKKVEKIRDVILRTTKCKNSPSIRWSDGFLIRCLKKGYWILFDNINFGNLAIIDRLNSILEPNGSICIHSDEYIKAHPNFRFFAAYNPSFGEISQSMRNRCQEIYVDSKSEGYLSLLSSELYEKRITPFPSIEIIYSNNLLSDLVVWNYKVLETVKSGTFPRSLFAQIALENSSFHDFEKRLQLLDISNDVLKSTLFKQMREKNESIYSKLKLPVDLCSDILTWKNHSIFAKVRWNDIQYPQNEAFLSVFLLRLIINEQNTLPVVLEDDSIYSFMIQFSFKYISDTLQLISDPKTTLNYVTFSSIYLTYLYFKYYQLLFHQKKFHLISLCWSWLRKTSLCQTSMQISYDYEINKIDQSFGYPESLAVHLFLKLYNSQHPLYFNDINQRIFPLIDCIHNSNIDIVSSANIIMELQEIDTPVLEINSSDFKYPPVDPLYLFGLLQLINSFLTTNSNEHAVTSNYFLNNISVPAVIRSLLYIFKNFPSKFYSLKSFFVTMILKYIFNDFSSIPPIHQSIINNSCVLHELVDVIFSKNYSGIKLIDCYVSQRLPFKINFDQLNKANCSLESVSLSLWSNLNIYCGWYNITLQKCSELLSNLINFHLLPHMNSVSILINNDNPPEDSVEMALIYGKELRDIQDILIFMENTPKDSDDCIPVMGQGFIRLGILLVQIYSNFPNIDPAFDSFLHNKLISEILVVVDEEILLRRDLFKFHFNLEHFDSTNDISYISISHFRDILNSLLSDRTSLNRPSSQYQDLKTHIKIFIRSLESNLCSFSRDMIDSINEFRINITRNFSEFSDLTAPIQSGLLIIQFGAMLIESLPKSHPENTKINEINIDTMDYHNLETLSQFILPILMDISRIVSEYSNGCLLKDEAFGQFYNHFTKMHTIFKKIVTIIDAIDLMESKTFIYSSPDEDYFINSENDDSFNFTLAGNKEMIIEFLKKVSFFIFEKLDQLMNKKCSEFDLNYCFISLTTLDRNISFKNIAEILKLHNTFKIYCDRVCVSNSNIYENGCPYFIPLISKFIYNLTNLIDTTLESFQTHPSLNDIILAVQSIQSIDISSPLIVFLNKMDQIYKSIMDWNLSTSTEYKLTDQLEEIKLIIIKMRKLQLTSWSFVLENFDRKFLISNSLMCFSFLEILTKYIEKPFDNIVLLFNEFCSKQPVGLYSHTFKMFRNIVDLLETKYQSNLNIPTLKTVLQYFCQFEATIRTFCQKNTDKIRKELSDYTTIVKWRDFNYWSIKESSDVAHRVLHKYINNYRVVMNYPVSMVLNKIFLTILSPEFNLDKPLFKILQPPSCDIFLNHVYPLHDKIYFSSKTLTISRQICTSVIDKINKLDRSIDLNHFNQIICDCYYSKDNNSNLKLTSVTDNHLQKIFELLNEIGLSERKRNLNDCDDILSSTEIFSSPHIVDFDECTIDIFESANSAFLRGLNSYSLIVELFNTSNSSRILQIIHGKIRGYLSHLINVLLNERINLARAVGAFNCFSKLIRQLEHLLPVPMNIVYHIPHNLMSDTCLTLRKISGDINRILLIVKARPHIPDSYTSPYFPSNQLNHSKINEEIFYDQLISNLRNFIEKLTIIRQNLTYISSQSFLLKDVYISLVSELRNLKTTLECFSIDFDLFSMFEYNHFQVILKKRLKNLNQICLEWSQLEVIERNTKEIYFINIKTVITELLIGIQNISGKFCPSTFLFDDYVDAHDILAIIDNSYKFVFDVKQNDILISLIKYGNDDLIVMFHHLVQSNHILLQNYLNFLFHLNYFSSHLFALICPLFQNFIKNQLNKTEQDDSSVADNNKTSSLDDNPIETGGLADGKGHKDVTDQLETQDQLQDAINKENMFESRETSDIELDSREPIDNDSNGIEMSDENEIGENADSISGQQDPEDEQEIEEDQMSAVHDSLDNQLDPDLWNDDKIDESIQQNQDLNSHEELSNDQKLDKLQEKTIEDDQMSCESTLSQNLDNVQQANDFTCSQSDHSSCEDHDLIDKVSEELASQCEEIFEEKENIPSLLDNQDNRQDNFNEDLQNFEAKSSNFSDIPDVNNFEGFNQDEKKETGSQPEQPSKNNSLPDFELKEFKYKKRSFESEQDDDFQNLKVKKCQIVPQNDQASSNELNENQNNICANIVENQNDANMKTVDTSKPSSNPLEIDSKMEENNSPSNYDQQLPQSSDEIHELPQISAIPNIQTECFFNKFYNLQKQYSILDCDTIEDSLKYINPPSTLLSIIFDPLTVLSTPEEFHFAENQYELNNLGGNLCEQLRMILEPTQMSKYQGNFKTGRRINIRKIIPYVASKFTQDKIWLRRTKPSDRDYQIIVAMDDSASMSDNDSKKIALQAMLVLLTAFRYLEVGKVSLLSFGESISTLLDFHDSYSDDKCKQAWEKMCFHQFATRISDLLIHCKSKFDQLNSSSSRHDQICEKLLIIISDGRGVFSDGEQAVRRAVRSLNKDNIFTIFIIMDPITKEKQSISDIKMPIFSKGTSIPIIKSYLEMFPFPYYIILRNIIDLPDSLSSIIRQWLELVSKQ